MNDFRYLLPALVALCLFGCQKDDCVSATCPDSCEVTCHDWNGAEDPIVVPGEGCRCFPTAGWIDLYDLCWKSVDESSELVCHYNCPPSQLTVRQ